MFRYILPALLTVTFIVLPTSNNLSRTQLASPYDLGIFTNVQKNNFCFPKLRQTLLELDRGSVNQFCWTALGQSRNFPYLTTTTAKQRVDFAIAYWHFLDKKSTFADCDLERQPGLAGYRMHDFPYALCRKFALSWWQDPACDKSIDGAASAKPAQIDEEWLQDSLIDAGELLYRAHVVGTESLSCSDAPNQDEHPLESGHKYLTFWTAGSFINHQSLIAAGVKKPNNLEEIRERAVLTGDAILALASEVASRFRASLKNESSDVMDKPPLRYSYINLLGSVAIPVDTVSPGNFCQGQAATSLNIANPSNAPITAYIDTRGAWHSRLAIGELDSFSYPTDLQIVPVLSDNGFFGYEHAGTMVIPARFDWAGSFHEGRALVLIDGKFGFIDTSGKVAIQPTFEAARSFSQGVAPAKDCASHKWGYIDKSGKFVIEPRFNDAFPFFDERAAVSLPLDEKISPPSAEIESSRNLVIAKWALNYYFAGLARTYFERAISAYPGGSSAREAKTYLQTRMPAKAVSAAVEQRLRAIRVEFDYKKTSTNLESFLRQNPDFEWAYTSLAEHYLDSGHFDDAFRVLCQVHKINPNYVTALVDLSRVKQEMHQREAAIQMIKEASDLSPNDDLVRTQLSALHI